MAYDILVLMLKNEFLSKCIKNSCYLDWLINSSVRKSS